MSYILDALKKLEHEKARKSRRDGMASISGSLFENERPGPSGPAGWKIALAVLVAVLVTFTATWLFLQSGKERGDLSARHAIPAPLSPPVKIESAPAPAVPPAVPLQPLQQTPPPASSAPAQVTPARPPALPTNPPRAVVQAVNASEDAADKPAIREPRRHQRDRKMQAVPAEQAMAAPADISLSGIAWQEERRARRAVVNGFLMKEGGVVSGARITDIYQDRVRFSQSGKTFEIPLISSAVPSAGK